MKNVPGRRTDWHECQWLQYLHAVGLLRAAFRPEAEVCAVRAVIRHRGATATAHKIAVIFYTIVTKQVEYDESIWAARDGQQQKRLEDKIRRQAKQLGHQLVPMEQKPAA